MSLILINDGNVEERQRKHGGKRENVSIMAPKLSLIFIKLSDTHGFFQKMVPKSLQIFITFSDTY